MRSMVLTVTACTICAIFSGCGPEAKKVVEPTAEEKAKMGQQHAAATEAIKTGQDPAKAMMNAGATPATAPTAGGHGK
ncbi:MAG: hypothetical protein JWM11_7139 [Planctomycetaceae bacterium]|nr:hypothetical protein [Planctomycetaceae bacterium]